MDRKYTVSEFLPFSGAIATDILVGRQREMEEIRAAIFGPEVRQLFRCVLLKADGGKGKTRLLNEVCKQLTEHNSADRVVAGQPDEANIPVVVLPLIDVADPYLHSVVAFLQVIRENIPILP